MKIKKILLLSFIIGIIFITFFVGIILADFHFAFINPPEEEHTIHIPLHMWWEGMSTSQPDIDIHVTLQYQGILVDGKKAFINATGVIHNKTLSGITKIYVGFKLALAYPPDINEYGMPAVPNLWIYNDNSTLSGNGSYLYWSIPGDFVPAVEIHKDNIAYPNEFPISNIHVEPNYILKNEKQADINFGLSIAFFYFALIGVIHICLDIIKNK